MLLSAFLNNPRAAAELRQRVRNHRWERTASGIRIPKMGVTIGGHAEHMVNGGPRTVDHNLVTDEGLNYLLSAGIADGTKVSTWYIAPFSGTATPGASLTAATFAGTQTEFTNYDESTRVAYVESAGTKSMTNTASPAQFTISSGGGTVWGGGVISVATKSATTGGPLLAAIKFSAARTMLEDDVLGLIYTLTAADDGA